MRLKDTHNSYGWLSIALHWLTAAIIITLWFIGDSIQSLPFGEAMAMRDLHISIAGLTYLVLIARIFWRFQSGHPRLVGQSRLAHLFAKITHYVLLGAVIVMLLSGPLVVWAGGGAVELFDWLSISSPWGYSPALLSTSHAVHSLCAKLLLIAILLHIAGAFKHLMFNDDETFIRMLVPKNDRKETRQHQMPSGQAEEHNN